MKGEFQRGLMRTRGRRGRKQWKKEALGLLDGLHTMPWPIDNMIGAIVPGADPAATESAAAAAEQPNPQAVPADQMTRLIDRAVKLVDLKPPKDPVACSTPVVVPRSV